MYEHVMIIPLGLILAATIAYLAVKNHWEKGCQALFYAFS